MNCMKFISLFACLLILPTLSVADNVSIETAYMGNPALYNAYKGLDDLDGLRLFVQAINEIFAQNAFSAAALSDDSQESAVLGCLIHCFPHKADVGGEVYFAFPDIIGEGVAGDSKGSPGLGE